MNQLSLRLRDTVRSAWGKSKGRKLQIWLPFTIIVALNTVAKYLTQLSYNSLSTYNVNLNHQIPLHLLIATQILSALFIAPIYTGIIINCIADHKHIKKITTTHLLCLKYTLPLSFTAAIIAMIACSANFITYLYFSHTGTHLFALVLFTTLIYPLPCYSLTLLALPLIYKRQVSATTSIKISFKIMSKHFNWLKITLVYFLVLLIFALLITPLAYGLLYKKIFIMLISSIICMIMAAIVIPFLFFFNADVFNKLIQQTSPIQCGEAALAKIEGNR